MSLTITNEDNMQLMARLKNESVDIICIDPPYKYLKNQKLETDFNELDFFTEAKRLLTKDGFIIMFGRGVSFYRMNCILADLGFTFKEEIIWDKTQNTSPLLPISRIHETISIWTKGKGKINKVKIPYLEIKKNNIESVIQDVKRLTAVFNNTKSLDAVCEYLKNNNLINTDIGVKSTSISSEIEKADRQVSTLKSIKEGCNEKSIIRTDFFKEKSTTDSGSLRKHKHSASVQPSRLINKDRCGAIIETIDVGLNEKSIIKQVRDHYTSVHPTQKPVRLLERLLLLCLPNKPKNEIVVADFFGGSMATMEAVFNLGVNGISCEIDKEYFDKAMQRINNHVSQQKLF